MGKFRRLAPLILLVFTITSCATTARPPLPLPDPQDPCQHYRGVLVQAVTEQESIMTKWALRGVALALTGVAVCALSGGDTKTCAIITVAIAFGTLVGGYMAQKSEMAKNAAELQGAVDSDSGAFGNQLGTLGASARGLSQCRTKQIDGVLGRLKAKKTGKEEAGLELARIQSKIQEDQLILDRFLDQMNKRIDTQVKARASASEQELETYLSSMPGEPAPSPQAKLPKMVKAAKPKTRYAATRVNVREEPSADSLVRDTVEAGKQFKVIGKAGNWDAIAFQEPDGTETTAYVSSALLADTLSVREIKGNDPTQKVYNINKSIQTQVVADREDLTERLEQARMLVG